MGHRDPSASEPSGHFSMSAHADEWAEALDDKAELRRLLWGPRVIRLTPCREFTKEYYPGEPEFLLFHNLQIAKGLTTEQRQLEALGRITHAENAKVGEKIQCPGCSREMTKKSYQHKYCKEKIKGKSNCKDFINNWFDPERLKRTLVRNGIDTSTADDKVSTMLKSKMKHEVAQTHSLETSLIRKWLKDGTVTQEQLKAILSE